MLKHLYRFYDRIFELMNWTYYWISIMLKINRQYFFRKWNKVDIFFSIIIRLLYWRVFTDDLLMEIRHFMKTLRKQKVKAFFLTLSWRGPLSYRNQSIDLQSIDLLCKSMDWFLYDNSPRHERVKHSYCIKCRVDTTLKRQVGTTLNPPSLLCQKLI